MIVFNEAKPKYEKMEELLENQLLDIRFGNQVNIFLDVKELSKKFFRPDITVDENNRRNLITEISSDILNTIGHYRNFFYKHGKYTTFYFLYSYSRCEKLMSIFPDYKKEYYDKYFGEDPKVEIIKKSIKAVDKIITKAIPHAYFIDTSLVDEFITTRYLLENYTKSNELNIVISNDDIFLQVLSDNTFVLAPKGIKSNLFTKENVIDILSESSGNKISASSLPMIFAFSGIKRYSFKSIPKVAFLKALNMVTKLVEKDILKDQNSIEIPLKFESLNLKLPMEKKVFDMREDISKNYFLIKGDNILYSNSTAIQSTLISILNQVKVPTHFLELNSKIYTMYPLQTDMILKGEQI